MHKWIDSNITQCINNDIKQEVSCLEIVFEESFNNRNDFFNSLDKIHEVIYESKYKNYLIEIDNLECYVLELLKYYELGYDIKEIRNLYEKYGVLIIFKKLDNEIKNEIFFFIKNYYNIL